LLFLLFMFIEQTRNVTSQFTKLFLKDKQFLNKCLQHVITIKYNKKIKMKTKLTIIFPKKKCLNVWKKK
jgi:hypothetical protein